MVSADRADTSSVAPFRLIPLAAVCALSLCAYGPVSPAIGTPIAHANVLRKSFHGRARPRRHAAHPVRCAIRSNFHARGGRPHHKHRLPTCRKRHPTNRPGNGRHAPIPRTPAAGGGPCPNATLSPNQRDIGRIRVAVLCLVNRERANHGERPLVANPRLEQAAQAHTESMAFGDYCEHVGPGGDTPLSRMRAAGYIYSSRIGYEVGENIGWGTLWKATPRAIVAAWMASPGHRANILDPRFRDTAIGVSPHPPASFSHHQAGGIYTQDFGVIVAG
jgi:uncharacterized protein YkwD